MAGRIRFGWLPALAILLSVTAAGHAEQALTTLPAGIQAPDFTLPDTEGNRHRLSDYRGRPVIINFWTTWCPPCREEMPSMDRAWRALQAEGIGMLAVNVGEDEETVFQFTANYPVAFPLLMDADSGVTARWPIRGLPTTFVVDPAGRLAYRAIGGRRWDDNDLLDRVRALKPGNGG